MPEHCAGIHLNMPIAAPPRRSPDPLTDEDQAALAAMARFQREETGYAQVQGTKPQTLGMALNDSPAGLLAWIVEKFRTWSDCDGDLENVLHPRPAAHERDALLGDARRSPRRRGCTGRRCTAACCRSRRSTSSVPTGVARYPKEEVLRFPRSWVEQRYNVTHWAVMPRGGHFAAMEQPELFVEDVRTFFRTVR